MVQPFLCATPHEEHQITRHSRLTTLSRWFLGKPHNDSLGEVSTMVSKQWVRAKWRHSTPGVPNPKYVWWIIVSSTRPVTPPYGNEPIEAEKHPTVRPQSRSNKHEQSWWEHQVNSFLDIRSVSTVLPGHSFLSWLVSGCLRQCSYSFNGHLRNMNRVCWRTHGGPGTKKRTGQQGISSTESEGFCAPLQGDRNCQGCSLDLLVLLWRTSNGGRTKSEERKEGCWRRVVRRKLRF